MFDLFKSPWEMTFLLFKGDSLVLYDDAPTHDALWLTTKPDQ